MEIPKTIHSKIHYYQNLNFCQTKMKNSYFDLGFPNYFIVLKYPFCPSQIFLELSYVPLGH